jgi:hypothetical protein
MTSRAARRREVNKLKRAGYVDREFGISVVADGHGRMRLTLTLTRDAFASLMALRRLELLVEQSLLPEIVTLARAQGLTWAEIGFAIDVTRQAAHKRYGHLDGAADQLLADESTRPAA